MLITGKIVICNGHSHCSRLLYIRARNADVHHNLNVSNPVPKVYTIYTKINIAMYTDIVLSSEKWLFAIRSVLCGTVLMRGCAS